MPAKEGGNKTNVYFPYTICKGDHLTYHCRHNDDIHKFSAQKVSSSQHVVLMNPSPRQQLVTTTPPSPHGGNYENVQTGDITSNASIFPCEQDINLQAHTENYDASRKSIIITDPQCHKMMSLFISISLLLTLYHTFQKAFLKKVVHNPHVRQPKIIAL